MSYLVILRCNSRIGTFVGNGEAERIINSDRIQAGRAAFYRGLLDTADGYWAQLGSGSSMGVAMAHLLRSVSLLSDATQYISAALSSFQQQPSKTDVSAETAETVTVISSALLRALKTLAPVILRIITAADAHKDPSLDPVVLKHIIAACMRCVHGCCALLTPQTLGLCVHAVEGSTGPAISAQLLCQCCTRLQDGNTSHITYTMSLLSEVCLKYILNTVFFIVYQPTLVCVTD